MKGGKTSRGQTILMRQKQGLTNDFGAPKQGHRGGGQEGPWPPIFRKRRILGNFDGLSANFRTYAVDKDRGLEFYRKIIELGPPTLQVPRRPQAY